MVQERYYTVQEPPNLRIMSEELADLVLYNCTLNCTGPDVPLGVDRAPAAGPGPGTRPRMPQGLPTWLMIAVLGTLCAFALIGNTLVIFCFMRFRKKFKQNTVAYLISLAISDLWIGFMTGVGILSVVHKRWVLGDFLCQTIAFVNNVALINSLWTVALGSVDRCLAIRMPFKYRSLITRRRVLMMILGTWLYAICLSMPPLLRLWDIRYAFHPAHPWCAMSSRYNRLFFVVFSLGFLPIPIFIILASYVVIFLTTRRYTQRQLDRISGHEYNRTASIVSQRHVSETTTTSSMSSPFNDKSVTRLIEEDGRVSASYDTLKSNGWTPHSPSDKSRGCFYLVASKTLGLFTDPPVVQQQDAAKITTSFVFHPGAVTSLARDPAPGAMTTRDNAGPVTRDTKEVTSLPRSEKKLSFCATVKTEEELAARKLQHQAATLLGVIGATILLSYTPILSVSTCASFNYMLTISFKCMQAFTLLMLSNASINPLIYFLLNKEFRLAAKSLFRKIFVRIKCGTLYILFVVTEAVGVHLQFTAPSRNSYHGEQCARTRGNTMSTSHIPSITLSESGVVCSSRPTSTSSLLKQETGCKHEAGSCKCGASLRAATEDKIQKHILRNSLVINEADTKTSDTSLLRKSGLINLSFYEVESSL